MKVFRLLRGRQGWVAVMVVVLTVACGGLVTFLSIMDLSVATPDPLLVACHGEDPNTILPNNFANFINLQSGVDLVVCMEDVQEPILLEQCQFDGVVVERYAYELEMWLVNQDTGEEFTRGIVRGVEPPSCEQSLALVGEGSGGVAVQGQPVSASDIEAWLIPHFPEEDE